MRSWWSKLPGWARMVIGAVGGLMLLAIIISFFRGGADDQDDVPFSTVIAAGRAGEIERIEVRGRRLEVETTAGDDVMFSRVDRNVDVAASLAAAGITIGGADGVELEFERPSQWGGFLPLFIYCLPLLLFAVVLYFAVRNATREGMRRGRADERAERDAV